MALRSEKLEGDFGEWSVGLLGSEEEGFEVGIEVRHRSLGVDGLEKKEKFALDFGV